MDTSALGAAAGTTTSGTSSATSGTNAQDLSSMFLKLLVTQLEHQDPTQPQDESQFIGQLAQFASLEQLTGINTAVTGLASMAGVTPPATTDTTTPSTSATPQA
jgi:flagellar basal-body rod modification protein FlgD